MTFMDTVASIHTLVSMCVPWQVINDDGAKITSTPSNDGVHYNHGLYDLLKPMLSDNDFSELPLHR
jgi:hypothetical protein